MSTDVHDQYGLPIWITEWNANPARDTPVQRAFTQMALQWMDTTPWIERYALGNKSPARSLKHKREDLFWLTNRLRMAPAGIGSHQSTHLHHGACSVFQS
jgi:hypothetical protein